MGKINSFEDMEVWQRSREFCRLIYELSAQGTFAKDYSLKDQINRSSGSIMDNIAEGFERGGNKEFIQFLSCSKGSCGEARSQLYRAFDKAHIDQEKLNTMLEKAIELSRQLSGLIGYLKTSELKGEKFVREQAESYGGNLES